MHITWIFIFHIHVYSQINIEYLYNFNSFISLEMYLRRKLGDGGRVKEHKDCPPYFMTYIPYFPNGLLI